MKNRADAFRTTTHSPDNSQPNDNYLRAKTESLQLLIDIDLYKQSAEQHFLSTVSNITKTVRFCSFQQKGEIFLLLCQSAIKLKINSSNLAFPKDFAFHILIYLSNLVEEESTTTRRPSPKQIYRGKLKTNTERNLQQKGKNKLYDLLIIERYDHLLTTLKKQLETNSNNFKWKFSKELKSTLEDSMKIAKRYLQTDQWKEYQANIHQLIQISTSQSPIQRTSLTQHQHDHKNSLSQDPSISLSKRHFTFARESSNHASSSKNISKAEITQPMITNEEIQIRKNSAIHRGLKRGSASSSYTLRSSILTNRNFNLYPKATNSIFGNHKPLDRNSIARQSELRVGQARPQRKSRLAGISKLDLQVLKNQIINFQNQESSSSKSDTPPCKPTNRIISYFQQENSSTCSQLHSFYLFIQKSTSIHLLNIEHQTPLSCNSIHIKSNPSFSLKMTQSELGLCLSLELSLHKQQWQTWQQLYQEHLVHHLSINKSRGRQLRLTYSQNPNSTNSVNLIILPQQQEGILMGFIRKISTYFIYKSKYQKEEIKNCYEHRIRKKLVEQSQQKLPCPLHIKNRILNCELTMSFQDEEQQLVNKGSIVHYIQNQELQGNNLRINEAYRLIFEHCTLKEQDDVKIETIWQHPKAKYQQPTQKKKGRKYGNSKLHKTTNSEEPKKLKRTPHNKSSIRIYNQNGQLQALYQQTDFKMLSRLASKKDMAFSQKKVILDSKRVDAKTKKQKNVEKRTNSFINTVKTEKGFKLVKISQVLSIEGCTYQSYAGFKERNPQLIRFWKNQDTPQQHDYQCKSQLSIRGDNNSAVASTRLISFLKPLENQDSFLGYLISEIKILTLSPNRCIFIQTYWQKMQKHFIFTLSSQFFQNLTDINTSNFWEQPFKLIDEPIIKKRDKRTSVMNNLYRHKPIDTASSCKRNKMKRENSIEHNSQHEELKMGQTRFKQGKIKFNQTLKMDKNNDHIPTFLNLTTQQKIQLKKQINSHLKNKLVKLTSFAWKNHNLFLVIKPNNSTQADPNTIYQFEGRELAVKNVHETKEDKQIAIATQLILIKYTESNLTNLNFFNQEGLNQITLEHLFIKNNQDLYGRYTSRLKLSQLPPDPKLSTYYRHHNSFFQTATKQPLKQSKFKLTATKFQGRQEQKRYKYVQILGFAKQCHLPFQEVQHKRRKHTKKSFIIPNRFKMLAEEDKVLQVHLTNEHIFISTLQAENIIIFEMDKLEQYLPYIHKLEQQPLKLVLLHRILEDQDIIRLCCCPDPSPP